MIDALRGTRRRRVAALAALLATTAACAASPVAKVDTTAELAATRPDDELVSVGAAAHAFVALDRTREKAMVAALSAPGATGAPVDLRELLASRATTRACAGASGAGECYAARGLTLEPASEAASRLRVAFVPGDAAALEARFAPWKLADLRAALGASQVVLRFHATPDGRLFAIALSPGAVDLVELGASAKEVERLAAAFHAAISQRPDPVTRRDWIRPSRALYDAVLRPLERVLPECGQLFVIAEGALQEVPFAALVRDADDDRAPTFADERWVFSSTPSAGLLLHRTKRAMRPFSLALFGDPENLELARQGVRFEPLPAARREARTLGLYFPGASVRLGAAATEGALKEALRSASVVHVATHAKSVASAPSMSFLMMAPSEGEDGLLTAGEIAQSGCEADMVVLSACETAASAGGVAADGLHAAFLAAGARSVLASLWEVDDAATAGLMATLYRSLGSHGRSTLLREAQRQTRATPERSHPYFWAAFVMFDEVDDS